MLRDFSLTIPWGGHAHANAEKKGYYTGIEHQAIECGRSLNVTLDE